MLEPLGTPKLITLHWTAGDYQTTYGDYHFCVRGNGTIVQTLSIKLKGAHTWRRNTGNIGISLCAMHPDGKHPVTTTQREAIARLCAELAGICGIDLAGTIVLPEYHLQGNQLIPTGGSRSFPRLADHAAFARADGYYPDRWDVGEEYAHVVSRAKAIREAIKARLRPNTMTGKVH